ncbi:MAG: glycosyltransferase [Pseudomonadota bacterium]
MKFAISVPLGAWHPFLPDCLASLEAQKVDVEVALLDASGDPRVLELADQYSDLLTFRHHGPDDGQADAIATGWENTSGDILGWLNADDQLFPDALSQVLDVFKSYEEPDVVYGHSTILNDDKAVTGYQYGVERPSERLAHAAIISQPSCFFKRSIEIRAGGLNRELHYTMDWDLLLRMHDVGGRFSFVDRPLSALLWSQNTKTASLNQQRRAEISRITEARGAKNSPLKTKVGFGLQHAIDHAPKFVSRRMRSFLFGPTRTIFGVGADGLLSKDSTLYIHHFDTTSKSSLVLETEQPGHTFEVAVNGTIAATETLGKSVRIVPELPLEPAKTYEVSIQHTDLKNAHLVSLSWF